VKYKFTQPRIIAMIKGTALIAIAIINGAKVLKITFCIM
jgi:hypothetical protein